MQKLKQIAYKLGLVGLGLAIGVSWMTALQAYASVLGK
jgi:hypothetical protein